MAVQQQDAKAKPVYGRGSLQTDIIQMAGVVAAHSGEDLQDVYDRHIRPSLTREYQKVVKAMAHDIGGEG